MTRYWGMIFIMFFSHFWIIVSVTTSIDLTLVGHLRGWKKLPYAKWLGGFIDKQRKGYKCLSDHTTHPQVVVMLLVCFGMLCLFVAMEVFIWFVANDIETFILWIIDAVLYIPTIVWLFFSKIKTNNEYKKYISNESHSN